MAAAGGCCSSLEEPKALMKMGLGVIIVGHVNFLLGSLVHGVVLRNLNLHKQARAKDYATSNVVTLVSGMLGVIVGILAIVLSKNKKSKGLEVPADSCHMRPDIIMDQEEPRTHYTSEGLTIGSIVYAVQTWSLFAVSLLSSLMGAASTIGLFVSMVMAIINGGRSLLTHCRFPDAIGYSSETNECPFDPTRIYSTTLILWVPLIVTCAIQLVFSARCFAACVSFLGLPCCPTRMRHYSKTVNVVRPMEKASLFRYTESPRSPNEPTEIYTELSRVQSKPAKPTRSPNELPRRNTAPPRPQHQAPPRPPPRQHQRSHSERQPLRQPGRERSEVKTRETRAGSRREREQTQPLRRGALERSSFWV